MSKIVVLEFPSNLQPKERSLTLNEKTSAHEGQGLLLCGQLGATCHQARGDPEKAPSH